MKPTIFRHIVRINPRCNKEAGDRLHDELKKMPDVVEMYRHGTHVIYVYAKRYLGKDLRKLARRLRFSLIFSWVEDSHRNPEDSCGMGRAGKRNQEVHLPDDPLQRFGFAAQLLAEHPLTFGKWEKNTIPFPKGKLKKYYFEHFLDNDARNKIRASFSSELAGLASYMTDNDFGIAFPWYYLTACFDNGSK